MVVKIKKSNSTVPSRKDNIGKPSPVDFMTSIDHTDSPDDLLLKSHFETNNASDYPFSMNEPNEYE